MRPPRGARSPVRRAGLLVAVGVALATVPTAAVGAAVPGTPVPLPAFARLAVDGASRHVFLSGGRGTSSIVAMNFDGTVARAIPGFPDAVGMVVVGRTLYVARLDAPVIETVDTQTLERTGAIQLPFAGSGDLAYAAGRLWFRRAPCGEGNLGLAYYDLSTGEVEGYEQPDYWCPTYALRSPAPGILVLGLAGLHPSTVYEVDVSKDSPHDLRGIRDPADNGADLYQVEVSPDRQAVLVALTDPYELLELRSSDLQPTGLGYPLGSTGWAIAVSEAGPGLVAAGMYAVDDTDVALYRSRDATPVATWNFGDDFHVAQQGLGFSPDGTLLFVVATRGTDTLFRAVPVPVGVPPVEPTTLEVGLSKPAVDYGQPVTVTAHVSGHVEPSHRLLTITATPKWGEPQVLRSAPPDSQGNVSVKLFPERNTVITATWEGDEVYAWASSVEREIGVRMVASVSLSGSYGTADGVPLYHFGTPVGRLGRVDPYHGGSALRFAVDQLVAGRWKPVSSVDVVMGRESTASSPYSPPATGTYRTRVSIDRHADHLGDRSKRLVFRVTS